MEQLVINMKNEYYPKDRDIQKLLAYIAGKGNNEGKEEVIRMRGRGISSNCQRAAKQIIKMQKAYKKNKARRCYHLIVSFPESMDNRNVVILAAHAIADMIWDEMHFQLFYGIHTSTDNLHIHFGINAVSYLSGRKWHQNSGEFQMFKQRIINIVNDITG